MAKIIVLLLLHMGWKGRKSFVFLHSHAAEINQWIFSERIIIGCLVVRLTSEHCMMREASQVSSTWIRKRAFAFEKMFFILWKQIQIFISMDGLLRGYLWNNKKISNRNKNTCFDSFHSYFFYLLTSICCIFIAYMELEEQETKISFD